MSIFYILIFPGLLFLIVYALALQFVDRKVYARLQNRKGPPWFQPLADFIKLLGKETIVPDEANPTLFKALPVIALAAAVTAFLYVPVWGTKSLFPFPGDAVVVLYLLTLLPLSFFLAGWNSSSMYATIGSQRVLTQLFAYEVPLFMTILGAAMLSGSWSFSGIAEFYAGRPVLALLNLPGLAVAVLAAQGKLERVPFDTPDAETEIVAGAFTEYGGRLYAFFKLSVDIETVVLLAVIGAVFLPFFPANPALGFLVFVVKTLAVLLVLTVIKTVTARLRIEQMVRFCWMVMMPLALFQLVIDLAAKGWIV
ncbi:MAG: NADH-quinone oxidoreductase subunit H [Firmicutes bacterium]|nr:NADH-quinone oxidoreductase subunit H [Bacillota bacterium]